MLSRKLVLAFGFAASLIAASCAVVGYDLDGYHPAEATTGSGGAGGVATGVATGTSSTGGGGASPNACERRADHVCGDLPPKGWSGPVALVVGDDAACAEAFPDKLYEGTTTPSGDEAKCSCSCDTTPCGVDATFTSFTDAACTTKPVAYTSASPACASLSPAGSPFVKVAAPATKAGVACAPKAGVVITPAEPGKRVVACGGAKSGAGCSTGEGCFPEPKAPFESKLCIFHSGDEACPAGLDKEILFTSLKDSRACASCGCGAPAATCGVNVDFYSDTKCMTLVGSAADTNGCKSLTASFNSVEATMTSPCKATAPMATGEVAGVDPTTFCCR